MLSGESKQLGDGGRQFSAGHSVCRYSWEVLLHQSIMGEAARQARVPLRLDILTANKSGGFQEVVGRPRRVLEDTLWGV